MIGSNLPYTACEVPMPKVNKIVTDSCNNCGKNSVCKYRENVETEIDNIMDSIEHVHLPLNVKVECNEWISNTQVRR